jgi:hypothetical protein
MTATPARPGAEESAKMVSSGATNPDSRDAYDREQARLL